MSDLKKTIHDVERNNGARDTTETKVGQDEWSRFEGASERERQTMLWKRMDKLEKDFVETTRQMQEQHDEAMASLRQEVKKRQATQDDDCMEPKKKKARWAPEEEPSRQDSLQVPSRMASCSEGANKDLDLNLYLPLPRTVIGATHVGHRVYTDEHGDKFLVIPPPAFTGYDQKQY